MKYTVYFTAQFKTQIELNNFLDDDELDDTLADIDIPETKNCTYISDSFEVDMVLDVNNKKVLNKGK